MVNFGLLTAEIRWRVWGTPANFNGFRVLLALLHDTLVVGVSQTLWRWTEGATYIRQGGHHVGHWPKFLVDLEFLIRDDISICVALLMLYVWFDLLHYIICRTQTSNLLMQEKYVFVTYLILFKLSRPRAAFKATMNWQCGHLSPDCVVRKRLQRRTTVLYPQIPYSTQTMNKHTS